MRTLYASFCELSIERLERQAAIDLEISKATSTALKTTPGEEKQGRASDEYTKAFWQHMRNRGGYEVQNALKIGGDGSEGGYLAPDEFVRPDRAVFAVV